MFGRLKKHLHGGHNRGNKHGGKHHHKGCHHYKTFHWGRFSPKDYGDSLLQPSLVERWPNQGDQAIDISTCPLCEKHCFLNEPGCSKGVAYTNSMNLARKEA